MKLGSSETCSYRSNLSIDLITTILVVLCIVNSAVAQFSAEAAGTAWKSYNRYFETSDGSGGEFFVMQQGDEQHADSGFWEEAEEIELAEDYYDFVVKNGDPGERSVTAKEVDQLCTGFINKHGHDWGAKNRFNDDLNWASIAFSRAYAISKAENKPNGERLADAKRNFDTVYERASTGNGGLAQIQPPDPIRLDWKVNLDAPVNFTFVIAGYLIYDNGGGDEYKSRADGVYNWSIANLYAMDSRNGDACPPPNSSAICGKVLDSNPGGPYTAAHWKVFPNNLRIGLSDFTYNYGIAIDAATRVGGAKNFAIAQSMANYLMYGFKNKATPGSSAAYDGTYDDRGAWNILPNYRQGGKNNAGYNGIALRGVGFGLSHGSLDSAVLRWAQANVQAAWNNRNADDVIWNTWKQDTGEHTPAGGHLYSWDCSAALAGIFDIPPDRNTSQK